MKREAKLGEIVYANPGDYFWFAPPKLNRTYRFQVGPAHGHLRISAWNTECGREPLANNRAGEDFLDHKCESATCGITVDGCRTAYQFVVSRTPNLFTAWTRSLFGH